MTQDLLIEIGTEELPPGSLQDLANVFAAEIAAHLTEKGIGHGIASCYSTPRRLAVLVADVEAQQALRSVTRRGPSVAAAFGPDGRPTKALEGFARSCGVAVVDLGREQSDKGEWIVSRTDEAGQRASELIPQVVALALASLPIAKRMRWGSGDAEFVRPVHWVCIVLGDRAVPGEILGVPADNKTYGHRFHAPEPLTVTKASDYVTLLREQGFVEPSFVRRRELIVAQVERLADARGFTADLPAALLDEVTALVEWPTAIIGSFDESFLSVPAEALIETMQKNQKYFPVRDNSGQLQASFIAVSNIESRSPEQVVQGNERVIRPRFADAKFFWEQDLRQPLQCYFDRLDSVVFQDRLGSVAQRSRRVAVLARSIAASLGEDCDLAERAALLGKCDLVTAMVVEFPGLQGIMGRYYAERSGEPAAVCAAIEEQYRPRFAGDTLPELGCGLVLALADRLDLLIGTFGIGHRPTGAKDPYALRRASIAVVRILIETPLELDLAVLLRASQEGFDSRVVGPNTADDVLAYVLARLERYFLEQGVSADSVAAVLASGGSILSHVDRRVRAVQSFRNLPAGLALAAANKRIRNILAKGGGPLAARTSPNPDLFDDDAERRLWQRVDALQEMIEPLIQAHDFATVLDRLADLREDVDRFFDQVMVMVDDPAVRENRLILLNRLQALFLNVADISLLH